MRLTDLNPHFLNQGGPGVQRKNAAGEYEDAPLIVGVGIQFDCPCGCGSPCAILFDTALDGTSVWLDNSLRWTREGASFETLTLKPSIHRIAGRGMCGWHGCITNGEVTTC